MKTEIFLIAMTMSLSLFSATSYEHSRDGKKVACGGEYSSYEHSRDGKQVCCGGKYRSYAISRDGKQVCFGGDLTSQNPD